MRKMVGTEVAYVHTDGHNSPTIHIFPSIRAAIDFIEPEDLDAPGDDPAEWDTAELRDGDGDLWFSIDDDGLFVVDHTKD